VSGFAGTTSRTTGAPFFRGGTWGRPLFMLFADESHPKWRVFSRNAVSARRTSIHGVEWIANQSLRLSIAGGIGNDKPYASSSASVDSRRLVAKAVFASHPIGFRRIEVDSPMSTELRRENFMLVLRPQPRWSVSLAHQNLVQDASAGTPVQQVTVNQAGGTWNVDGLRIGGTLFGSNGSGRNSQGSSLTIGRQIGSKLDVAADYFRFAPRHGRPAQSHVLTMRETLHPRFALLEVVTVSGGQTGFNVGGEFLSNPLSLNVSYQTIYAPLRAGNPFVQFMGVDVRVHGLRGVELRAGTYATPSGSLKYLISVHRILSSAAPAEAGSIRFPKYAFRGLVVDVDSRPVAGAVVRLGDEVVITGEDGRFLLGVDRAARVRLAVLTNEFVARGVFDVLSAPSVVKPTVQADVQEIRIVLRRR
jgi:hypothetical protein